MPLKCELCGHALQTRSLQNWLNALPFVPQTGPHPQYSLCSAVWSTNAQAGNNEGLPCKGLKCFQGLGNVTVAPRIHCTALHFAKRMQKGDAIGSPGTEYAPNEHGWDLVVWVQTTALLPVSRKLQAGRNWGQHLQISNSINKKKRKGIKVNRSIFIVQGSNIRYPLPGRHLSFEAMTLKGSLQRCEETMALI